MRTARTRGVPLAFLLLVLWGGAVACKDHSECGAIAVGTPLASLPQVIGPPDQPVSLYCYQPSPPTEEVARLYCCSDPSNRPVDGGVRRCGSQGLVDCSELAPYEVWEVGLPYGGWSCEPQPDFPSYGAPYNCYVWVRDGGVIGRCSGCEPD